MVQFEEKEEYLEVIKTQIRCKKAKNMVADEIDQHIEDQKDSYTKEFDDDKLAMVKALEQMGDPVVIGKQLDKIHRPRMEWFLLLAVMTLCGLGVLAQLSLGNFIDDVLLPNSVNVGSHIFFLTVGIVLMVTVYFLDYSIVGKYSKVLCILFLLGFFLFAPFNTRLNGSIKYLHSYGLLFIPIYGGIIYAYRKKGYIGFIKCLLISIIAFMIEMVFVAQSSTYLGVLLSSLMMLTFATMKNWFNTSRKITIGVIWGWMPFTYAVLRLSDISILAGYQKARLEYYFNPILHTRYYESNFRSDVASKVINDSKLFGESNHLMDGYIPGFNTDYILTYIIGEWGIIAGMLIVILFIAIIGRMFYLSYRQKNSLGMFVGLGCSLVFAIQGSIYILSNLGIQLMAQVNLPFVSFGGSSLLVNFIVLGLMLSVFRNTSILKEVPYKDKFILRIERNKN